MKLSNRASAVIAGGALALLPVSAFAEEKAGAGGVSILIPKMAEFIPALIAFLLILIVAAKLVWPTVLKMMDEREQRIAESLDEAEKTRQKAIADRKASDEIVTDARRQAAEIVLAARQDAEAERNRILAAAHTEAEDILAKAHASSEEERRSIYADAAASIADLSVSVASKIVAKTLDEDGEQRRLIERYIEEAGSLNAD